MLRDVCPGGDETASGVLEPVGVIRVYASYCVGAVEIEFRPFERVRLALQKTLGCPIAFFRPQKRLFAFLGRQSGRQVGEDVRQILVGVALLEATDAFFGHLVCNPLQLLGRLLHLSYVYVTAPRGTGGQYRIGVPHDFIAMRHQVHKATSVFARQRLNDAPMLGPSSRIRLCVLRAFVSGEVAAHHFEPGMPAARSQCTAESIW